MKTSEGKEVRFLFEGDYHEDIETPPERGINTCDFCEVKYKSPHIVVDIAGFTICPSCIKSGPAAVAAEAKRIDRDRKRLARMWGYDFKNWGARRDASSMAKLYRSLAAALHGLHSFEDLPGGKFALNLVPILQAPVARRKRKAA